MTWYAQLQALARSEKTWHGVHTAEPLSEEQVELLYDLLSCHSCGAGPLDDEELGLTSAPGRAGAPTAPPAPPAGPAAGPRAPGGRDLGIANPSDPVPGKGSRWHNLWHLIHGG